MSLPLSMLKKVTTIVSHANPNGPCPDGTAAAILAHDVLPKAKVIFVSHGMPAFEDLKAEPGMLFLDVCPPEKRVEEFLVVDAMVLDHHPTSRHVLTPFALKGHGVFGENEKGESGAVLAFEHVWMHLAGVTEARRPYAKRFAKVAGIRDTWKTGDEWWDEACEQAAALVFYPWRSFSDLRDVFHQDNLEFDTLMEVGEILVAKDMEFVNQQIRDGVRVSTEDRRTRLFIVPTTRTSDVAEAMKDEPVDVVVGFQYRGERGGDGGIKLVLSTRARGGYDVGAFCAAHGGGGHKSAAGVTFTIAPRNHARKLTPSVLDADDPYAMILGLFNAFEQPK